ncbi:unnamed protein product [Rotaria socialis]
MYLVASTLDQHQYCLKYVFILLVIFEIEFFVIYSFKMVTYVQINIFLTLNDFVFNLLIIIKCINEENFQKLLIELCI